MFNRRRPKLEKYIYSPNELSDALDNTKSCLFDGVNEYVTIPDNPIHQFAAGFSASIWFKFSGSPTFRVMFGKISAGFLNGFGVFHNGTTGFGFITQGGGAINDRPWTFDTNWHHWVGVANGTTAVQYIDGVAGTPTAQVIIANTEPLIIGSLFGTLAFMIGNLDEFSLWNAVLTAAEVSEIYNAKKPQNLFTHSRAANLVSWWRLGDGDTFPTIKDVKAGANGTMTNMEAGDIVADVP